MPVSVFRDVYQITHVVPGLEALLHHRFHQHQLLWQVSPLIRRHLLYNRRSLNAIFELMDWAATFGLLRHFEKKLQFSETVSFELVTELIFPRPLTPTGASPSSPAPSLVRYTFSALEDFDNFVDDVELHLLNKKTADSCPPDVCPFKEELKMHTLYVFGRKAGKKRPLEASNSGEGVATKKARKGDGTTERKKRAPRKKTKKTKKELAKEARVAKRLAKEAAKRAAQQARKEVSFLLYFPLLLIIFFCRCEKVLLVAFESSVSAGHERRTPFSSSAAWPHFFSTRRRTFSAASVGRSLLSC